MSMCQANLSNPCNLCSATVLSIRRRSVALTCTRADNPGMILFAFCKDWARAALEYGVQIGSGLETKITAMSWRLPTSEMGKDVLEVLVHHDENG